MSAMFSGPPKPPAIPAVKPPRNTALDAEMQAIARRQGSAATILAGNKAAAPSVGAHTVTGQ